MRIALINSGLGLLAPAAVLHRMRPDADLVLLVKPQFEAGRARIGKGGIVRDPAVHLAVLAEVVAGLAAEGLVVVDVMPSPLRGADGNVEFLVRVAHRGVAVDDDVLAAAVAETSAP